MARLFLPLVLVALLLAPALPVAAGEPRADMKVHTAGVQTDTLAVPWRNVYRVAMIEMEKDEWTIQRADSVQGRFVTRWKKVDHPLSKLVFGELYARCVVDVKPLSATQTELNFRGGLAGPENFDRNPAFGSALTVYYKAAERLVIRVRKSLAATSTADPAAALQTGR